MDIAEALALLEIRAKACPGCGHDRDATADPAVQWVTEQTLCRACANSSVIRRDFEEQHKKHKPKPGAVAPWDGVRFTTRRKT